MKKLSEKYITIYEVKELVQDRLKQGKRIYEQELLEKYLQEFADLDTEKVLKAKEQIKSVAPNLSDKLIVKLLDVRPKTYEQILLVLAQDYVKISEEEAKKILEILSSLETSDQSK
jgi:DNA-directed RNA polymerase subunit F